MIGMTTVDKEGRVKPGSVIFVPKDYVQIVRCKDCKYSSPNRKYGCNLITDDGSREMGMLGDDYCSYGERKEEE